MKKINLAAVLLFLLGITVTSCNTKGCTDSACSNYDAEAVEDDGSCICDTIDSTEVSYEIPSIYSFENVSYSGQTTRINMLKEMVSYLKKANTPGVTIDSDTLKMMFGNTADVWSDSDLNGATKDIKSKTYVGAIAEFEGYLDSAAAISGNSALVLYSADSSKNYIMNSNGFEYTQLFEKGLFGAFLFHQIAGSYLTEDKIGNSVDNSSVTEGTGTAMEHHWDEAFGYLGVPVDFPSNTSDLYGIGKYSNAKADALLGTNATLMNAFIKGRAAISNKDYTARDEQVTIIIPAIEQALAASAINYCNSAKSNILDAALRNHALSEAIGFIRSLKYSSNSTISSTQIDEITGFFGDNLNEITVSQIDQARDAISTIYGLDTHKNDL